MTRCDSAHMMRNAAKCINPKKDRGAYSFMLEEMAGHIEQVRKGEVSLAGFARFYMIQPEGDSE